MKQVKIEDRLSVPEAGRPAPPSPSDGLGVGAILSLSFQALFANFFSFAALSFLAVSPLVLYSLSLSGDLSFMYGGTAGLGWQATFAAIFGLMLFTQIAYPAIAAGTLQYVTGRKIDFFAMLRAGLRFFLPALVIAILTSLGTSIGMLLFVVPGLILSVMWMVALPAAVAERLGPLQAIERSGDLTSGYRWPIFGIFLIEGG
ncbi:hypothetical protein [Kordiimonas aestuarii]|uniref:hypothetical protein n=1 Tax=Kordiimonas aestuarii TaxID=1005925 RepID=UPI0021CE5FD9|nr:hypothetical protein [Kordiimonas aestuarii]